MEMLFLVFLSLIMKIAHGLPEIKANCGQLEIQGYQFCKIITDDKIKMYMGPEKRVFNGPFFGLIKYKCDQMAGYLMSNIDCEKCDFECSEEDATASSVCQTDAIQFWSGVILGIFCFALIGGSVWMKFFHFRTNMSLLNFWKNSSSRQANESVTKIERDKVFKEEPDEVDGLQSFQSLSGGGNKSGKKSPPSKKIMFCLFSNLLFQTAYGCDVKVVSGSNNGTIFCQNSECTTLPLSFTVKKGYEICVEDELGQQVSVQISDIIWRIRYELKYYTSDYNTDVTIAQSCCELSEAQCLGMENKCYNRTFAKLTEKMAEKESTNHYCLWSGSNACIMSCIYLVEKTQKGGLYGIFKRTGEAALIVFNMKGKQHSRNISLTNYDLQNYQLDLTHFQLKNIDSLPVTVRTFTDLPPALSLLVFEGKIFYVNASEYHYPNDTFEMSKNDDSFVDFQVSLDKLSETYIRPSLQYFEGDGCGKRRVVGSNVSMISRFMKHQANYNLAFSFLVRDQDHSVIDIFEDSEVGKIKMYLDKTTKKDWELMAGQCDVEFSGSYGCSSCNERAYVVLEPRNVTKEGLIPFYSNCSFDKQSITCDYEPVKLILKDNNHTCLIKIPTMNKQFLIHVTHFKFGHQIKHKEQINCTTAHYNYGEAAEHLITSKTFVVAYFKTVVLLILFSLFSKIVLTLIYKRKVHYVIKKEEDFVEL